MIVRARSADPSPRRSSFIQWSGALPYPDLSYLPRSGEVGQSTFSNLLRRAAGLVYCFGHLHCDEHLAAERKNDMITALKWIGRVALAVLVLALGLYYLDSINLDQSKLWML